MSKNEQAAAATDPTKVGQPLLDYLKDHRKPDVISVMGVKNDGVEILAVPNGVTLHSVAKYLDEYRDQPERRLGTAEMKSLQAFIDYANRYRDEHSAIFAWPDESKPSLTVVFNQHEALRLVKTPARIDEQGFEHPAEFTEIADGDEANPRFGDHRAVYNFPLSKEWLAWRGKDGTPMDTATFAEFLETRIPDVLDPGRFTTREEKTPDGSLTLQELAELLGGDFASPKKLMEISRGLAIHAEDKVSQVVNLSDGTGELTFASEHRDREGQKLKVPSLFMIGIPVFHLGDVWKIPVRLRYRKTQGGVIWFYEIWRWEKALDTAFDEACAEAAKKTGLPKFLGKPEQKQS